jgi:serine/threonine-protein kinase
MSIKEQAAKEPREGAVIAGKYRLSKLIQRGGMGAVWLARHASLDLPYAVKFIRSSDEATMVKLRARFEIEAKAVARLHGHPNIVQIIDHGIDGDIPYIVMELLSGETLQARLRRERRLSLEATKQVLAEIVAGLTRAHSLKIVHRDLKPGNIFFARSDNKETVKILDFGIVKMLEERQPIYTTGALGTTAYMSPEQIRNDRAALDERTDLWSLAVILFECLTGERPHSADNDVGIIGSILLGEGPSWNASGRVRGLPPALDTFFMRAFSHEKADRFQTAADLLSAFESAARPVGTWIPSGNRALLTEVLPHEVGFKKQPGTVRPLGEEEPEPKEASGRPNSDEMETVMLPGRGSGNGAVTQGPIQGEFTKRLPKLKLIFFSICASLLVLAGAAIFLITGDRSGSKESSPAEPASIVEAQPPAPPELLPTSSASAIEVSAKHEPPPEAPAASAEPAVSAAPQPTADPPAPRPVTAGSPAPSFQSPYKPPQPPYKPPSQPPPSLAPKPPAPSAKPPAPSPAPRKPPASDKLHNWILPE